MNQIMLIILGLVNEFIDLYILYMFLGVILKKKEIPTSITIIIFSIGGLAIYLISKVILNENILIPFFSFTVLFAFTFLYRGKMAYKIFILVIFFVLAAVAELLSFSLFMFIENTYNYEIPQDLSVILIILTSRLILFPFIKIASYRTKHKNNNLRLKNYLLIILIPILCIFILFFIILNNFQEDSPNFTVIVPIIFVLIIIFSVTYLFENIIDKFELEHKTLFLDMELKNQQHNFEKTSVFFRDIAKMVHDTNNHLQYVSACIKEGRHEESIEYLDKTLHKLNSSVTIVNSGNLLIDTMLSNAAGVAKEHNIKMLYEINLGNEKITIDVYDLCVILSNAIDNALEASKKVLVTDNRFLNIKITCDKDNLTIKIENRANFKTKTNKNGFFSSDKNNNIAHGIGLENIQNTVNKYNGELLIEERENVFYFAVLLPLRQIYAPD